MIIRSALERESILRSPRKPSCRNRTHGTGMWRTRGLHGDNSGTVVQYIFYTSSKIKQEIQAAQYSTTRTTATISRFGHGGLSARLLLSSDVHRYST